VGVWFIFIFLETFFFIIVLLWALFLVDLREALCDLVCCLRYLRLTKFWILDIVEKVESIDKFFFW